MQNIQSDTQMRGTISKMGTDTEKKDKQDK